MKRREFIGTGSAALLGILGAGEWLLSNEASAAPGSAQKKSVSSSRQSARSEFMKSQEAEQLVVQICNTRENARLLHTLVRLLRARHVLEVGTYQGYSTLWMAMALEEQGSGKLTTVEVDPVRVSAARRNMRDCGVESLVTCLEGDAHQVVKTLNGRFDLIFLDADRDRNEDYLKSLWPLLNSGGILVVNGAVRFRHMMRNYFEELDKKDDALTHLIKTFSPLETEPRLDDALAVTLKKP